MRIERMPDGTWRVVGDDGNTISEGHDSALVAAGAMPGEAAPAALLGEPDAEPIGEVEAPPEAVTASADLADVAPRPPAAWFADPGFTDDTTVPSPECDDIRGAPLTITADGRVFGHAALWGTCHIGFEGECISPPPSPSGYAYYRTGQTMTAEGELVATGRLTVGTGHASTDPRNPISAQTAAAHYDDTGVAVADVAAGEDAYGIWVAGAIRPGATVAQVEALRRSALSGDWRRIRGNLELVAALAVNVPGFPVPRYGLAAAANMADPIEPHLQRDEDGEQLALVAAGSQLLAQLAASPWASETEQLKRRVAALERQLDLWGPHVRPLVASGVRERLRVAQ